MLGMRIAIEYHGTQHFRPVDFFGGREAHAKQLQRDQKKAAACKKNGVILLIFTEHHSDTFIENKNRKAISKIKKSNQCKSKKPVMC